MKKMLAVFGMVLVGVMLVSGLAWAEFDWSPGKFDNDGTIGKKRALDEVYTRNLYTGGESGGTTYLVDADGNVVRAYPNDAVVYIDSTTDLFSWDYSPTAGQSCFLIQPGKLHIVKPHAIVSTGCEPGGTTAMNVAGANTAISAVSGIMYDASVYEYPMYETEVLVWADGAVGATALVSGPTEVQVWPFPGTGATRYRYGVQAASCQNMLQEVHSSGQDHSHSIVTGASYYALNKLGESAVFGTDNGGVSVFLVRKNLFD